MYYIYIVCIQVYIYAQDWHGYMYVNCKLYVSYILCKYVDVYIL